MPMNSKQIRVVDPVLTTVVRGYSNNEFVGSALFPFVPAPSGGKVLKFGKESFALYDTERARGADAKRINVGYEADPFALALHDLDAIVSEEDQDDAVTHNHIDLAREAVETTMKAIMLRLEYDQAKIARNPANYDTNNVIALTDVFSDVNLREMAQTAKSAVQARIGKKPNVVLLGPDAESAFKSHPLLIAALEKVGKINVTRDMIAEALDVPRLVVGDAIFVENINAEDSPFVPIWGNSIIYAYVPEGSLSARQPSYGYTYRKPGHPLVRAPYPVNSRRSMAYGVSDQRDPQVTSDSAGCLITGVRTA